METIKNYFKFYYHLGTSSGRIISENTSKLISNIRRSRLKLNMKKLNYKQLQIKLLFKGGTHYNIPLDSKYVFI